MKATAGGASGSDGSNGTSGAVVTRPPGAEEKEKEEAEQGAAR